MKKIFASILLFLLLSYIFLFPGQAIQAASHGLLLWWNKLLPTLLPFAILSYVFVESQLLKSFVPIKSVKIYPLLAGFLFGFPLGSKITAHLVNSGQMDYATGNRLFALCNNISPLFISGYVLHATFQRPQLTLATLAMLYLPPLLFLGIGELMFKAKVAPTGDKAVLTTPGKGISLKIIDAGIMNGFDTLTRLGGYLMLFAIFSQMTAHLPFENPYVRCLITGMTEISNGIHYLGSTSFPFETKYLLMLFFTAFGGLSGIAQTASMTREAGFSMGHYIKMKFILGLCSLLLGIGYLHLLS